jgi:hypothetical protein
VQRQLHQELDQALTSVAPDVLWSLERTLFSGH